MNKKVLLTILDGWGIGNKSNSDAISKANTPYFDGLINKFSNATLKTFGEYVGLPNAQMGNSEVGHLNIGAGRVVYQMLAKINKMVEENAFEKNEVLNTAIKYANENNKQFHLMGLISDGGIHSHINHLKHLMHHLKKNNVKNIVIHGFTDGRDTDPKSGKNFVKEIIDLANKLDIKVASIIGRYFAMDRDKRWERIKLAYDLLLNGVGEQTQNLVESIEKSYQNNITDEFVKPTVKVDEQGKPIATINENDVVFAFNFRTDRCRQITEALTQQNFEAVEMKTISLQYFTMTEYNSNFKNVNVVIKNEDIKNTLGEVLARNNKTQLRMAETEKYPHVTFFFNGGNEVAFEGEERIMVNSPKVATYDLQPEMSAPELNEKLLKALEKDYDFICINFANTDMVGHTGDFNAVVKATETVDELLSKAIEKAIEKKYIPIIIADHGNADFMVNENGTPNTAHTTNLVPIIIADKNYKVKDGKLGDIAPTVLNMLEVEIPKEMDGEVLV